MILQNKATGLSRLLISSVNVVNFGYLRSPSRTNGSSPRFNQPIQVIATMYLHPLVAVLALFSLGAFAQTEKIQIEPLLDSSQPQAEAMFLQYSSDGDTLTKEEVDSLLNNGFSQVQELNDEVRKELMRAYDTDGNSELTLAEFKGLFTFISRH
ncbi:hypothetical protein DPEC_G00142250 [Dallia pectoralis]|uniref:Uncharacterized protein n=1 Tax=Dallia pectoralis TaxID=75939 RepID=A0ACC2GMV8_DALPE|nr:hypothetical protein DPEC_G00142250 [Dallia pectoralis]